MRKVVIIIIALILMLGISACKSVTATHDEQRLARDAYYIAYALNMYNVLYPSETLTNDITLEKAKETVWEDIWPAGLSDEEEKAAWKLILFDGRNWVWALTPETQQAFQEGSRDESEEVNNTNASMISTGINVYNAINPNKMLPDDVTLAEVKEALERDKVWPSLLTYNEVEAAWELIEIKDGLATVKREG